MDDSRRNRDTVGSPGGYRYVLDHRNRVSQTTLAASRSTSGSPPAEVRERANGGASEAGSAGSELQQGLVSGVRESRVDPPVHGGGVPGPEEGNPASDRKRDTTSALDATVEWLYEDFADSEPPSGLLLEEAIEAGLAGLSEDLDAAVGAVTD